MDVKLWAEIAAVLGLILLNGFLAMAELAMVSSRRGLLEQMARRGKRGAATAVKLLEDPTRFLSTVQVGITLIGVLAGAFSGATLGGDLGVWLKTLGVPDNTADTLAIVAVVVAITYLSLILGELVPKRLAMNDPERIACRVARPMLLISHLASPLVWLLRLSTVAVLRLLGVGGPAGARVTADEIRALLAEGAEAGVVKHAEREMMEGVMRIADLPVRSIMTPRVDVTWLDLEEPFERARATIESSGHSRYPVARGRLDDVVGILHVRKLATLPPGSAPDLVALADAPLMVPESTPILRLIERFRAATAHLAIVVDEYGAIEGVVTPADVLGAIAGHLPEGRPDEVVEAAVRDDGSWLVDGRMEVHRVERLLNVEPMTQDGAYSTLAGFVLWQLGRMPRVGQSFVWHGYRFEVVDLDGRRIDKVLIERLEPAGEAEAEASSHAVR